jgi:membrane protein required for colicin V production
MNWLDILLVLLAGASVVSAFLRGFTRELVGLAAVIAALLLGYWFYGMVAGCLEPYLSSRQLANLLGFLAIFGAVMLVGALVGRLLRAVLKVAGLSFFDRMLGAGFGFVRAVLIAAALMTAFLAFAPGRKTPRAIVESRLAPYVMAAGRACVAMAPHELRDGFHAGYGEIRELWQGSLKKLPASPSKHKDKDESSI